MVIYLLTVHASFYLTRILITCPRVVGALIDVCLIDLKRNASVVWPIISNNYSMFC